MEKFRALPLYKGRETWKNSVLLPILFRSCDDPPLINYLVYFGLVKNARNMIFISLVREESSYQIQLISFVHWEPSYIENQGTISKSYSLYLGKGGGELRIFSIFLNFSVVELEIMIAASEKLLRTESL